MLGDGHFRRKCITHYDTFRLVPAKCRGRSRGALRGWNTDRLTSLCPPTSVEFQLKTKRAENKNAPSWCKCSVRIIEICTIMVHISSSEDNNESGRSDMLSVVRKTAVVLSLAGADKDTSFNVSVITRRIVSSKRLSCCAWRIQSTTYSLRCLPDCAEKRVKASRWRGLSMSNVRYRLSRITSP